MHRRSEHVRHVLLIVLALAPLPACGCHGEARLSLDDVIVGPQLTQLSVTAYVERERRWGPSDGVSDELVEFYLGDRSVGGARTNREGRSSFTLPGPLTGVTAVAARAMVDGRTLQRDARVIQWDPQRVAIVVDVDNTLAETDLDALLFAPRDDESDPLDDSVDVLQSLARDFQILYLTARPRFLGDKTRDWLERHGYPAGPLLCAPHWRNALDASAFKARTLVALRRSWPNVLIGIGDQRGDAEAYRRSGMLTLVVLDQADDETRDELPRTALAFDAWDDIERFFRRNTARLRSAPAVRRMILQQGD